MPDQARADRVAASEPIDYIERTRTLYDSLGYPPYRWVRNPGIPPWTPVRKPLESSSLVLIASGGIYEQGQRAFHYRDDTSFRVIDAAAPPQACALHSTAARVTERHRRHFLRSPYGLPACAPANPPCLDSSRSSLPPWTSSPP